MTINDKEKEKLMIKAREAFDWYWYLSYIKVSTGEYDKLKELNLTREEIDAFRDIIWMKRKEDLWHFYLGKGNQSESKKEWSGNVLIQDARACGKWSFFHWYESAREELEKKEGEIE